MNCLATKIIWSLLWGNDHNFCGINVGVSGGDDEFKDLHDIIILLNYYMMLVPDVSTER